MKVPEPRGQVIQIQMLAVLCQDLEVLCQKTDAINALVWKRGEVVTVGRPASDARTMRNATESFREISVPLQPSRSEGDGFSSICWAAGVLLHGRVDDRLWAVSKLQVGGEGQRFLKSCIFPPL